MKMNGTAVNANIKLYPKWSECSDITPNAGLEVRAELIIN